MEETVGELNPFPTVVRDDGSGSFCACQSIEPGLRLGAKQRHDTMDTSRPLQLILPTDKRNPCFTLYRRDGDPRIHVYYGMELLEVVPDDRTHLQFKLLVGNLYNAGLRVASLEQTFAVDRKTMRRWAAGIKSGDAEQFARAMAGRGAARKLTAPIQAFVRLRFQDVYGHQRRRYNAALRQEIRRYTAAQVAPRRAA